MLTNNADFHFVLLQRRVWFSLIFEHDRLSLLKLSSLSLMVLHLLPKILHLFRLYFIIISTLTASSSSYLPLSLSFLLFDTPFLNFIQLSGQFRFLLVVSKLLIRPIDVRLESFFAHFLIVDELLSQVVPLEPGKVLQGPQVIVELVFALFTPD